MKIGNNIGPETINKEYKELCFPNLLDYFNEKSLYELLYNYKSLNKILFNNMVEYNLNEYFIKYIPKYLSIFSKSKISGELYIGVDDLGFIEGIPYYGNLDISLLKTYINSTIEYTRGIINDSISKEIKNYYYSNIDIKITELNFLNEDEQNSDIIIKNNLLNDLEERNNLIKDEWNKYYIEYDIWQNKIKKYSLKLIDLLSNNNIRKEIKEYIIKEFNENSKKNRLNNILKYYDKNDNYYKNKVFTLEYIQNIIKDEYHPLRWLIQFKDYKLNLLKYEKPIVPNTKVNDRIYYLFCNNINNFRTHLYKSNNQIKFYMIKININIPDNILYQYIEYKKINSCRWISKKRILNNIGEPITIY